MLKLACASLLVEQNQKPQDRQGALYNSFHIDYINLSSGTGVTWLITLLHYFMFSCRFAMFGRNIVVYRDMLSAHKIPI
jgi:hypothetical protein